jgi:CHAT domain-containing protein
MMHRFRASALFVFLVLLFVTGPVSAQYMDPAAETHAWSLYRAYDSEDSMTFQQLVSAEPALTKKAFLFTIYYTVQQWEVDQEAAMSSFTFATELAKVIQSSLGDPTPAQIANGIQSGNEQAAGQLESYRAQLYPELASSANTGGPTATTTTSTTVGGPPFPATGGSDPAARKHAYNLYTVMQSGDKNKFQTLFSQDPTLTKKAFLSVIEFLVTEVQKNPNADLATAGEFATGLAQVIESHLNDPVPSQIVQKFSASDNSVEQLMAGYVDSLYSQTANNTGGETSAGESNYVFYGDNKERASNYQPEVLELLRPIMTKLTRAALAISYTDPSLMLQELDTFGTVLDDFKETIVAKVGAVPPELQKVFDQAEDSVELFQIQTLAEYGMLSELGSRAMELAARDEDINNSLGIYFTGFRVAYRQQQFDQAQKYLDITRKAIAENSQDASPVFRFLEKTSEFQLRVAREGSVSSSQVLSAFDGAWSELSGYQAMYKVSDDTAWYYGQAGTRYWIRELAELGPQGEPGLLRILESGVIWIQKVLAYDNNVMQDSDDSIFHATELQGFFTTLFVNLDILLYVFEQRPDYMARLDGGADAFLGQMGETVKLGAITDSLISLNLQKPGFPPFTVANSSGMKRLRMRLNLLKGLDPGRAAQERVAILQTVSSQMAGLELPDDYINYHLHLGHAFQDLGKSDSAILAWKNAQARAEELGYVTESVEAASLLTEEFGRIEDWSNASTYASKANAGMQQELGTSDSTVGLAMAKKTKGLTQLGAVAAIKSNDPKKALAMLSEGQQMNTAAVRLSGNSEAATETKKLQKKKKRLATLSTKVETLKQMPAGATRDEMLKKAETLLAESKSDFLLQSRKIRQKFSGLYTTALRFDPLNLPDVQAALPMGTAVVQYFATDQELYIFVVTKSEFRLRSVKESKSGLDGNVASLLQEVQRPGVNDQGFEQLSVALYQTLIAPIEKDLAQSETVILIPSGKLNLLPFAALKGPDGKLLVEKKTLLELAKPTDFMKIASSKVAPVTAVVAFANATEDLPSAEKEGHDITSMFENSTLYTRKEASKSNLMEFGKQPRTEVLHLATHGTWDAKNSLNNHLKLANDEQLSQEEIFNLNLSDTPIVTLSACSTALADTKDVEYVASLAEAFWIAGSRTVVASLWPVDDVSTGMLMTSFYEHLKAGDGKAEALRKAQLEVRQDDRYSHPYFWSGFLLFGDYR